MGVITSLNCQESVLQQANIAGKRSRMASAARTIKLTIKIDLIQGPDGGIRLGVGACTQEDTRLAVVRTVAPNSAAARGGLQPGDVVSTWDGEPLTPDFTLASALGACTKPKRVILEVMRQINTKQKEQEEVKEQTLSKLITVWLRLSSGQKSGLKLQGRQVISGVPGSLAEKAGLLVGDELHSWDGVPLGPQYTPQQAI